MKMWDSTWFVLGTQDLSYYSRGNNTPKLIDLQQTVSIVSADVEDAKRPHSFKLTSPSFPRPLILAAETSEQADEWIAAIRAVATLYAPPPESPNGPPKLTPDNRNMLDCTMRIVQSTGKLIISAAMAPVPGVYSKLLLDNLSMSALMCGTTGRVVVYKPKVQSGGQRFTQSVTETMGLVVKYKHTYQSARRKAGVGSKAEDPLADVTTQLESLIEVIERTVSNWMPNILDPELTKPIDDAIAPEDEEEREDREMGDREKGESGSINPYVSPFFINPAASPPPCKKHWDLLVDECAGLIAYMEHLSKDENSTYRLPSPVAIDQAKLFLTVSRKFHEIPNGVLPDEDYPGLTEESFSLMKQQLLGSVSSIDYHTASIGLCADAAPPQIIDVISHAHGISSAITKLPRAIRKHRTKTLVSAIESIGSFSLSLSKLIMQMMDHESFSQKAKDSRPVLQDEVHAVQYIAIHMMGLCALLIEGEYKTTDILPLTDTAKLLALGVTNTLESLRFQLSNKNNNNNNGNNNGNKSVPASSMNPQLAAAVDPVTGKPSPRTARRKLESEIKDAATGSMVFWFGMVGQNVCVHLEA